MTNILLNRKEKTMKIKHITLISLFVMIFFAIAASAEIKVISVTGSAAYKVGNKWVPLKTGLLLAVGTKVSTGARSRVEIKINKHTVTVEPLTMMKISESKESESSSTTELGLRRGAVKTVIDTDKKVKTIFNVSTPVATSSVRGSAQFVRNTPGFRMDVKILSHNVQVQGLTGGAKLLSGDLQFTQKPGKGGDEGALAGQQDFVSQTAPKFVTPEEQQGQKVFGDDNQFYTPGSGGGATNPVVLTRPLVPVTVTLTWPTLP